MINNGRTRIWHINSWKFSSPAIYNAVCISLFNAACHLKMLFCHFILASLSLLLFFSLFSVVKNFTVFPFKSRWTGKTHVFPIMKSKSVATKMEIVSCSAMWKIIKRQNYYNKGRFNNWNARNRETIGLLKITESKILLCWWFFHSL